MMKFDLIQFMDEQRKPLQGVLDLIPIPLFTKDREGIYLSCNKAFEEFSGFDRDSLIGKSVFDLWPKTQAELFHAKDKALIDNPGLQVYEADISTSFGRHCIVEFHKTTFLDTDGNVGGLMGAIFDLTEIKKLEDRLTDLANTDELTGIWNRRYGMQELERVLSKSIRHHQPMSLLYIDLDYFKTINDTYGHKIGDTVLKSFKSHLSHILRDYDILFRYGGEEFILCLPETDLDKAKVVAERIRALFENKKIIQTPDLNIKVTLSIGIANYPVHSDNLDKLLSLSDLSLYDAKNSGRNCVQSACKYL